MKREKLIRERKYAVLTQLGECYPYKVEANRLLGVQVPYTALRVGLQIVL